MADGQVVKFAQPTPRPCRPWCCPPPISSRPGWLGGLTAEAKSLWISLGNFIAKISATHSPGDGCQGLAVAATDLVAQQPSDHRAYADANRAILCNRCRLLVHRCWTLVDRCLGILLVGLRLCVPDRRVTRNRFVLCAFMAHGRSSGHLRHGLLRGCSYRYDGGSLCGNRQRWRSGGLRIRQNACDGCDAQQAHEHDGHGCARHEGVNSVRGLIHFHFDTLVVKPD